MSEPQHDEPRQRRDSPAREDEREARRYGADPWPTRDEVEAWAERERERRQRWAEGPTEEEKAAWARRIAYRRAGAGPVASPFSYLTRYAPDDAEAARLEKQYRRDTQLALEGAFAEIWRLPFQILAALTSAGRNWEEEDAFAARSRRVPLYDDDFYPY
jgi:hypothetical protein